MKVEDSSTLIRCHPGLTRALRSLQIMLAQYLLKAVLYTWRKSFGWTSFTNVIVTCTGMPSESLVDCRTVTCNSRMSQYGAMLCNTEICLNHWIAAKEWSMSNFFCSLTRGITPHSMANMVFHSLLGWKMIMLPILTTFLTHFLLEVGRIYFLSLGEKGIRSATGD